MSETDRPTPNSARATRTYPVAPGRLLPAVRRAVEGLPRWSLEAPGRSEVRAVRKTRLFRFRDDVTARVYPDPDGARLELTSTSRLGRGDLGQNPATSRSSCGPSTARRAAPTNPARYSRKSCRISSFASQSGRRTWAPSGRASG
ncbi:MAG: DUF1499 domain-containing protein [Actinomycetota bacterium]|nr:DUF1499 domain-containing protein [Actinomycetota bacterium]